MTLTQDDVIALVQELVAQADKLGWKWQLTPATVVSPSTSGAISSGPTVMVDLDGDELVVPARALSLIGVLTGGERVMVLWVPPEGAYVIGRAGGEAAQRLIGVEVRRDVSQNITTGGAPQNVSWDAIGWDVGDFVPASPPFTDVVIPILGRYLIVAAVAWQANATGFRFGGLYLNTVFMPGGGTQIAALSGASTTHGVSKVFTGQPGDVLQWRIQQGSGVTLTASATMTVSYLGAV